VYQGAGFQFEGTGSTFDIYHFGIEMIGQFYWYSRGSIGWKIFSEHPQKFTAAFINDQDSGQFWAVPSTGYVNDPGVSVNVPYYQLELYQLNTSNTGYGAINTSCAAQFIWKNVGSDFQFIKLRPPYVPAGYTLGVINNYIFDDHTPAFGVLGWNNWVNTMSYP
jgi:hypothetical protein